MAENTKGKKLAPNLREWKTPDQMRQLIHDFLHTKGRHSVSHDTFYDQPRGHVRDLKEEYSVLSLYAESRAHCEEARLAEPGAAHDGELRIEGEIERVQIVLGNINYSSALKREVLKNNEMVFSDAVYSRDEASKEIVRATVAAASPKARAREVARLCVAEIHKKLDKGYDGIPTLACGFEAPSSTAHTNAGEVTAIRIRELLKIEQSSCFKKLILVDLRTQGVVDVVDLTDSRDA